MKHLPTIYYLPYISPQNFARFAAIFAGDEDFPDTHADWEAFLDARAEEIWASKDIPVFKGVDPAGFERFVACSTAPASIHTLLVYVALIGAAANDMEVPRHGALH